MAAEQMATPLTRRRFTAEEYVQLGEAGILRDERVELIEGEIVTMSPISDAHIATVMHLDELLKMALGTRALVLVQGPVRINPHSEPEPDLAVLRRVDDYYSSGKARPSDISLLIEVAGSSAPYDATVKAPLYARNGVSETWILLLDSKTVRVLRDPGPDGYRDARDAEAGETVSPLAFPDLALPVASLFPPFPSPAP